MTSLTTLHRRYPALPYLVLGAVPTAFIPFPPETKLGVRLFFSLLVWLMISFGLWQLAGIPRLLRDIPAMFRRQPPAAPPLSLHHKGSPPVLSAARQANVRRTVAAMAEHGVFAPETPDPALLYAGVADMDESVKPDTILRALSELDYYHPGTDPALFTANLAMLESKAEQWPDTLRGQIADLDRLAGGALRISDIVIDAAWPPAERVMPVRISLTVNGEPLAIAYDGDVKYASTHIQHALATRLDAANSGRRFAWLWTDQGAWISALPDGAVEALNAAFKLTPQSRCCWSWVGDAAPIAAGDIVYTTRHPGEGRDPTLS